MYEIKEHSDYVAIWQDGQRIAKVPLRRGSFRSKQTVPDKYGLAPMKALAMARRIVDALEVVDAKESREGVPV